MISDLDTYERIILSTKMFCQCVIEREGAILPKYAEFRTTSVTPIGAIPSGPLQITRKGHETEPMGNFYGLDPTYRSAKAASGKEERELSLFPNSELLVASADGYFIVRHLREPGAKRFLRHKFRVHQFRDPEIRDVEFGDLEFRGNYFWDRVNPFLDRPFVHPKRAHYSSLSFKGRHPMNPSNIPLCISFQRLCGMIFRATLHEVKAEVSLRCATRRSPASVSIEVFAEAGLVSGDAVSLARELLTRLVDAYQPFSEAFRSDDPLVGAWSAADEAQWIGKVLTFEAPSDEHAVTLMERALLLPQLRENLQAAGVRCDDIFSRVSV